MTITVFKLLHAATCAALFCWLVTVVYLRFFYAAGSAANNAAGKDGLSGAINSTARWGSVFALLDLVAHALAWLYGLSALGPSPLESLFWLVCICLISGVAGMVISTLSMLTRKSASADYAALMKRARRLPVRLIMIGVLGAAVLAFLSV